ncbi:50S ribosomal protein L23 [Spatholobus suberectus]|nr:50S ribosomal protein L23 [Spatholobus suberectus]
MAHIANIPMMRLMPMPSTSSNDIRELAFKTAPSASKVEIKRFLETFYGFEVQKVRTLNMKGKKKRHAGSLVAKPDYKKAYVTLKKPLPFSQDLFPFHSTLQDKKNEKVLITQR